MGATIAHGSGRIVVVHTLIHRSAPRRHVATPADCTYYVDDRDIIRFVGGAWPSFARDNAGLWLDEKSVVGTPLWDHIHGLENRLLYKQVIDSVRATRHSYEFAFRCDSPDVRRLMRMKIAPGADDGCGFTTWLVHTEPRPHLRLLDTRSEHGESILLVCNWCMHAQVNGGGEWKDIDEAWRLKDISHRAPLPMPVFTICPACLDKITRDLP